MSRSPTSAVPPGSMRDPIGERVRGGEHGNASGYRRDRVRREKQAQAVRRFRLLIADGLESGEGRPLTPQVVDELRVQVLGSAE